MIMCVPFARRSLPLGPKLPACPALICITGFALLAGWLAGCTRVTYAPPAANPNLLVEESAQNLPYGTWVGFTYLHCIVCL